MEQHWFIQSSGDTYSGWVQFGAVTYKAAVNIHNTSFLFLVVKYPGVEWVGHMLGI